MKKIFLGLLFISFIAPAFSQTLEQIAKLVDAKDYKGARTAMDNHMAVQKNQSNPESWYYKGWVYNAMSYQSIVPEEQMQLKLEAYDAFRKNQQLDGKDIRMKLENYRSYLELYFGLYDLGATFFNDRKYDSAFKAFTSALQVKDYILSKNYTYNDAKLHKLDTALVMNSAISAMQAKKEDVALQYYKQLADASVSESTYEEVYQFLAEYYLKKKDDANMKAILDKAKRLYPKSEYWADVEMRSVSEGGDKDAMFAKYESMMAENPDNFALAYNYGVELFNSIYGRDAKQGDNTAAKAKLTEVLKKAIALDKGNDATILMTNHLFNAASDLSIEASTVKGTKPEDVKKKKDLTAATTKAMDEFIPYGESSIAWFEKQPSLDPVQKANYRIVLGYMSDVYNFKKDPKKAEEFDKKKAAAN